MTNESEMKMSPQEELALLKERANILGVSYGNNISIEGLRKKILEEQQKQTIQESQEESEEDFEDSPVETEGQRRFRIRREALALIRVRITNHNPNKQEIPGEIFSVSNRYIGTVKKYIPYAPEMSDNGYHLPMVIYKNLKSRKFWAPKIDQKTQVDKGKFVNEFSFEVLPPLDKKKLEKLALAQAAASGMTETD